MKNDNMSYNKIDNKNINNDDIEMISNIKKTRKTVVQGKSFWKWLRKFHVCMSQHFMM